MYNMCARKINVQLWWCTLAFEINLIKCTGRGGGVMIEILKRKWFVAFVSSAAPVGECQTRSLIPFTSTLMILSWQVDAKNKVKINTVNADKRFPRRKERK